MKAGRGVHLDEGTLVRLVDDELSAEERRGAEGHLAGCGPCREERNRIAGLSRAFSEWAEWAEPAEAPRLAGLEEILREADGRHDRPDVGGRTPFPKVVGSILRAPAFRAAAVLVLLAGAAIAFPPVSRWVEERVGGSEAGPVAVAPAEVAPGSISISFVPAGNRLAVRIDRLPAGGSVRIAPGPGPEVEARVAGGGGGEELTVLPDGLAVRNPDDVGADYAIRVPATVWTIDLYVAGRRVWSGAPDALPMEWTPGAGADAPAGEGAER